MIFARRNNLLKPRVRCPPHRRVLLWIVSKLPVALISEAYKKSRRGRSPNWVLYNVVFLGENLKSAVMDLQISISVNFHASEHWIRMLYTGNPTEIFCQTSATRWGRTRNRRRDRNVFRDSTEMLQAIFENDRIGTRFFQIMWSFYEWETHLLFPTSDSVWSQNWRIISIIPEEIPSRKPV